MSRRKWLVPSLALFLIVTATSCSDDATPPTPSPFADCTALSASPSTAAADVPDLRLPCFTGGHEVALRDLRGPAVVNIWASWCGPCRAELPVMQSLAAKGAGQLTVLGVDVGDSREAGASFATDKGVTMPTLFDADRKMINALALTGLPATVFIDATGKSYVHPLPLDAKTLPAQVREHTGVSVTL